MDYGAGVMGFGLWSWGYGVRIMGLAPCATRRILRQPASHHPPGETEAWCKPSTCPHGTVGALPRQLHCLTSPLHRGSPLQPTTTSPPPTCGVYRGQARGEAQPQAAVVPRVSQHIQGQLRLFLLVHGAVVLGQNVADLARSCHQALCRETTVSPGPQPAAPAGAPGPGWVRLSSPCLRPPPPLGSPLPKRPPGGLNPCHPGAGDKVAAPSPALPAPLAARGLSVPQHGAARPLRDPRPPNAPPAPRVGTSPAPCPRAGPPAAPKSTSR